MKTSIYYTCKTLAKTAITASLSISLLSATVFAQEAPANPSQNLDIQLQKVDGPRKTGRKRPIDNLHQGNIAESKLGVQNENGEHPRSMRNMPESANSKPAPTIRRLDADKVQELRTRIRTERGTRIRDIQFQEERTKNVRRLVQIERIRTLAEENNDQKLLERANQLRDKEIQRHTRKLAQLRHDGLQRRKVNMRQQLEKTDSPQAQ